MKQAAFTQNLLLVAGAEVRLWIQDHGADVGETHALVTRVLTRAGSTGGP